MATYFVVPHKELLDTTNHAEFSNKIDAVARAERLKAKTGEQYHVIKFEVVHTTQTLEECLAEVAKEAA